MEKYLICILFVFVMACSHGSGAVVKDTDYLKYGQRASVIQKVWGEPEETMAYQDFQAKRQFYSSSVGGSWGPYGGSIYGHGSGSTYVPTTIVWIYKDKKKALFFQKGYLLYDSPGAVPMVWRLVGWENLISDQTTKPQITPPSSGTTTVVTVTWTSANIRSGAGNEFPVLTTVNKGDRLTIIGERGEWFNVRLEDGKEGWINSRVVK